MTMPDSGVLKTNLEATRKNSQTVGISVCVHQGMFLEAITVVLKNLPEWVEAVAVTSGIGTAMNNVTI